MRSELQFRRASGCKPTRWSISALRLTEEKRVLRLRAREAETRVDRRVPQAKLPSGRARSQLIWLVSPGAP